MTSQTPRWTIVTVTYNSSQALLEHRFQLERPDCEWIVVDNASSDDSISIAASLGASVVALDKNIGFARANNLGVDQGRGKYLLFLNPDVVANASDLDRFEKELDKSGGILAPQLENDDGTLQPNGRGEPYLVRKARNRIFKSNQANKSYWLFADSNAVRFVDWVTGAVVAMTRSDFFKVGRWNEDYFLYYEDTELCLRTRELGLPVRIDGHCTWQHSWARATIALSAGAWKNELRSAARFYSTHPKLLMPKF